MVNLLPLREVDAALLGELAGDIASDWVYDCRLDPADHAPTIQLVRRDLGTLLTKAYQWEPHQIRFYSEVLARSDSSLLAVDAGLPVGIAIAEPTVWNNSLTVWEFHVHPGRRRQGIGRLMMNELDRVASRLALAELVIETQADNGTAIDFYRACGFHLQGIDTGMYGPDSHEVALFLRRRVTPGPT